MHFDYDDKVYTYEEVGESVGPCEARIWSSAQSRPHIVDCSKR